MKTALNEAAGPPVDDSTRGRTPDTREASSANQDASPRHRFPVVALLVNGEMFPLSMHQQKQLRLAIADRRKRKYERLERLRGMGHPDERALLARAVDALDEILVLVGEGTPRPESAGLFKRRRRRRKRGGPDRAFLSHPPTRAALDRLADDGSPLADLDRPPAVLPEGNGRADWEVWLDTVNK